MNDELLTFEEARGYLKIHKATLYKWIREKKIPASKIGRMWRFKKLKLEKWIDQQTKGD
jgi:excisionase family DNA binding protein